ncbi:MAG TPA: glycosyltransferase [Acidimicrobiales bacterium]|nr:glycosyltransferase [Acidimicrobiales bacterium]
MAEPTADDLAVIIPTRERWDILARTLASLSNQTVSGFETIVVVDGTDQDPPPLEATTVLVKRRAGPAAARNAGARATTREIVMYLGDDTIPASDLVERHLAAHRRHPESQAAVVGFVDWHDSVAANRINSWLDWSGTQFWFSSLARDGEQEVSHWHFYTSNVSLKRELLLEGGGFDEDFPFAAFEDIECALRLSHLGLRLYYEPGAVCHHLHGYDWPGLERRFASMALSERLMVEMHPDVAPGCLNRMKEATTRPALPLERWADVVPARMKRLGALVRHQANRHYHRRLAPTYLAAWDRAAELCELRRYLDEGFDSARLVYGSERPGDAAPSRSGPDGEDRDEARLFDLAREALTGSAGEALTLLERHLPPRSKVLDFGCGIGTVGLGLAGSGHAARFADQPGPPLDYLRWRLAERGARLPVYALGVDALPADSDAAVCLEASGPGRDPVGILRQLEELAPTVVLGLDAGPDGGGRQSESPAPDTGTSRVVDRQVLAGGRLLLFYRRTGEPSPSRSAPLPSPGR